jgi:predicted glycosyltransferase
LSTFLYHAFGGGLGHAVRTLSLARQLRRHGGRHVVNVNTPFAACLHESGIAILTEEIEALVERLRPELFVVDTFPRGVRGELVRLLEGWSACPRVLIARSLPYDYVTRYRLREWVSRHYDLVLCPGEPTPFDGVRLPPFLMRDREALPAGVLPEIDAIRHFPLIELLPRARVVIGAAGFNLVHECAFVGVPGEFTPMPRRYDDQAKRLKRYWRGWPGSRKASTPENNTMGGAVPGSRRLDPGHPSPTDGATALPPGPVENGAGDAARAVLGLLGKR